MCFPTSTPLFFYNSAFSIQKKAVLWHFSKIWVKPLALGCVVPTLTLLHPDPARRASGKFVVHVGRTFRFAARTAISLDFA